MTPDDAFTLPDGGKALGRARGPAAMINVRGVLTFDDLEGGCVYLETASGGRFEIVYPAGWVLDRHAASLHGPDGQIVVAGSQIEVEGALARDRSSICQIGPIVEAIRVVVVAG